MILSPVFTKGTNKYNFLYLPCHALEADPRQGPAKVFQKVYRVFERQSRQGVAISFKYSAKSQVEKYEGYFNNRSLDNIF